MIPARELDPAPTRRYESGMARYTPAVMRALDIIELFVDRGARWNAAEVVDATGLPRTTVHELLTTLTHRGYLVREPSGHYQLGARTVQLGNAYAARFDLLGAATEAARGIAHATGETCSVAILEGSEVFYLAKVDGREVMPLISSVGKRVAANCTGLGKVLLSVLNDQQLEQLYGSEPLPAYTDQSITSLAVLKKELAEIRRLGYATEIGESGPNTACAAAPIRDVSGEIAAALSITVPLARWAQFPVEHWARIAITGADKLSAQLGHVPSTLAG